LGDLLPLKTLPKLEYLAIMGNPVSHKPHYRPFVVHSITQVRVLVFRRIRVKERESARQTFAGDAGSELYKTLVQTASIANLELIDAEQQAALQAKPKQNAEEMQRIKEAIVNAKTLHEVEHLQQMLAAGHIPGKAPAAHGASHTNGNGHENEENIEEMELES